MTIIKDSTIKKIRHKNFIKIFVKKSPNFNIYRPFLDFSRFDLLKFCYFWDLPIFPDQTNQNIKFLRNRIRFQFLPYIKYFINVKILKNIKNFQFILKLEDNYFIYIIDKIKYIFFKSKISINIIYFPIILQYKIIKDFLKYLKKKISLNEINSIFIELKNSNNFKNL